MKLVFKNAIDKPVRDMNITGCEYFLGTSQTAYAPIKHI
jgi:hypothetical protein